MHQPGEIASAVGGKGRHMHAGQMVYRHAVQLINRYGLHPLLSFHTCCAYDVDRVVFGIVAHQQQLQIRCHEAVVHLIIQHVHPLVGHDACRTQRVDELHAVGNAQSQRFQRRLQKAAAADHLHGNALRAGALQQQAHALLCHQRMPRHRIHDVSLLRLRQQLFHHLHIKRVETLRLLVQGVERMERNACLAQSVYRRVYRSAQPYRLPRTQHVPRPRGQSRGVTCPQTNNGNHDPSTSVTSPIRSPL
jgi:hypothetical protein